MSEQYHRKELEIALNPADARHILPPPAPVMHRVLDVGCGAGQTLIAAFPDRISYGVDIDRTALVLGKTWTESIRFVQSRAEELPWCDESFDLVIARVSLAYSDIGRSLREIRRILKPGGKVWMTLHPFKVPWQSAKAGNIKGKIYFLYVLLNSGLFHFFQKQFPFRGAYESFQTGRGISKALIASGFSDVSIDRGNHFVVGATRTG